VGEAPVTAVRLAFTVSRSSSIASRPVDSRDRVEMPSTRAEKTQHRQHPDHRARHQIAVFDLQMGQAMSSWCRLAVTCLGARILKNNAAERQRRFENHTCGCWDNSTSIVWTSESNGLRINKAAQASSLCRRCDVRGAGPAGDGRNNPPPGRR